MKYIYIYEKIDTQNKWAVTVLLLFCTRVQLKPFKKPFVETEERNQGNESMVMMYGRLFWKTWNWILFHLQEGITSLRATVESPPDFDKQSFPDKNSV